MASVIAETVLLQLKPMMAMKPMPMPSPAPRIDVSHLQTKTEAKTMAMAIQTEMEKKFRENFEALENNLKAHFDNQLNNMRQ